MKGIIILLITVVALQSCSSDDNYIPPANSVPGELKVEEIDFIGKQVTINWNDVVDDDGDRIYYKLYIDSELIKEYVKSEAIINLEYNSSYEGRIIATDKKGGVSEIIFSIDSPRSKIIFFSGDNGKLAAFDLITNQILWVSETTGGIGTSITTYDDKILFGKDVLSISNKDILFSFPVENYYRSAVLDDNYLITESFNKIKSYNKQTNALKWEKDLSKISAALSIDESNIFVCGDDRVYAFDKENGELSWEFELDDNYLGRALRIDNSNPLTIDNNLYFGDSQGRFYSINKDNGAKNWSIALDRYSSFSTSPTIYKSNIIVGTDNSLYSFNKDGSQNWSLKFEGYLGYSSPFVDDENIYISSEFQEKSILRSVDANTGIENWKFETKDRFGRSPIVYKNKVYFGDKSNFYCIDGISGNEIWKIDINDGGYFSPILILGNGEEIIYPGIHGLKN